MKIAKSYNKIADSYDNHADAFHLLTKSRIAAEEQIKCHFKTSSTKKSVIDVGVGSGLFLRQLAKEALLQSSFTGLDISEEMLAIAKKNFPSMKTVCGSIDVLKKELNHEYYDLVVAHFVLAYIDLSALLAQAAKSLTKQGVVSIVTTTQESFYTFQKQINDVIKQGGLIGKIVDKLYTTAMKKTFVPKDYQQMQVIAKAVGFEIVAHKPIETKLVFHTAKAMADFSFKGGWSLNAFDYPFLPMSFSYHLLLWFFKHYFDYPFEDKHIVQAILFKPITAHDQITV